MSEPSDPDASMDCREFLDNHALFVDLRCSAIEERAFQRHAAECPRCAHHDAMVRRSLLLVKSLPTIEPSPDFRARLDARLRLVQPELSAPRLAGNAIAGRTRSDVYDVPPRFRPPLAAFATLAAAALVVAVLAANMIGRGNEVIRMAPVVATLPEPEPSQSLTPALVATVPTGMSVWPAIMAASQASVHFVAAELAPER